MESTSMNNYHLIYEGDYLIIKVYKLRSEVTNCLQKIEINCVMNNISSFINIG
ncbi:hypothetical protein RhiirB3_420690 [Rhizophagus irregularis]|nr:hypothetical protein RhiirB3_420690 [Rhizophagus irregularis]